MGIDFFTNVNVRSFPGSQMQYFICCVLAFDCHVFRFVQLGNDEGSSGGPIGPKSVDTVWIWATTWFPNCGCSNCPTRILLPWTKKEPCCWCIKSESCDICRGIRVFDSAAEPAANTTCDCHDFTHRCIAAKSDCRFFNITWCITRMVLFFFQGSTIPSAIDASISEIEGRRWFLFHCTHQSARILVIVVWWVRGRPATVTSFQLL